MPATIREYTVFIQTEYSTSVLRLLALLVFALGPLALDGGKLRFNTLHIVAIIIPFFFPLKICNICLMLLFFEICLLYVHINNKYLPHVVDNMIFGISVPDYPILTVGTTILG